MTLTGPTATNRVETTTNAPAKQPVKRKDPDERTTNTPKKNTYTILERVMSFMFYCVHLKNIALLTLALFNDIELYTSYIEYLKGTRKLIPSTIVAHLIIAVNVVKFNIANLPADSDDGQNNHSCTFVSATISA